MSKLKLELYRFHTLVFGRVLEQAEELRNVVTTQHLIAAEHGMKIISAEVVELDEAVLSIRGKDSMADNDIFYQNYGSALEAENATSGIKIMVDRINGQPDNSSVVKVM